jgi:prefoldin subunit 5
MATKTIDERIETLVGHQEKTQILLAEIVDTIQRLERIALAHTLDIDDLQTRLTELEQRRRQ